MRLLQQTTSLQMFAIEVFRFIKCVLNYQIKEKVFLKNESLIGRLLLETLPVLHSMSKTLGFIREQAKILKKKQVKLSDKFYNLLGI